MTDRPQMTLTVPEEIANTGGQTPHEQKNKNKKYITQLSYGR